MISALVYTETAIVRALRDAAGRNVAEGLTPAALPFPRDGVAGVRVHT